MLIPAHRQPSVSEPENGLEMRALVRSADTPDISVTRVVLAGRHRPLRTDRSTRVYYLLEGSCHFSVGEAEPFGAHGGDAVVIPRGVEYSLEGHVTYLVLNSPAYVEGDDVYRDQP